MMHKNFQEEARLRRKGYKHIAGIDEAGRGPLAGPVVACAIIVTNNKIKNLKLQDSKKLSSGKREEFYNLLTKSCYIKWGIGRASEKVIDRINILEATKLAMEKAIKNLKVRPDFLIIDGNFKLNLNISQKSIIKADEKVFSCMAAGIIAKVSRDRIMQKYAKKYPEYKFEKHKGYPTKLHLKILKKHAPLVIHRKTFRPVKACSRIKY